MSQQPDPDEAQKAQDDPAVAAVVRQWEKYRPKFTAQARKEGNLEQLALEALEDHANTFDALLKRGLPSVEALHAADMECLSLPDLEE